jgi:hypothetical protein
MRRRRFDISAGNLGRAAATRVARCGERIGLLPAKRLRANQLLPQQDVQKWSQKKLLCTQANLLDMIRVI